MPIRGTKIVLIDQEMYELSAPENEGRVLLQHKVCISVACECVVRYEHPFFVIKYGCEKYGKNNVT